MRPVATLVAVLATVAVVELLEYGIREVHASRSYKRGYAEGFEDGIRHAVDRAVEIAAKENGWDQQ